MQRTHWKVEVHHFAMAFRMKINCPFRPEADLFRRGKQILGNSAGGLISKLLKSTSGDIEVARAAIETASTAENPCEYVAAIIRGRAQEQGQGPPPGGYDSLTNPQPEAEYRRECQNW